MFFPSPWWERPAELCEPYRSSHLSYHFFIFHSVLCYFSNQAEKWASWLLSPSSLWLPNPSVSNLLSSLTPPLLPSSFPIPLSTWGPSRSSPGPMIGPIVYSLQPDTKDIKLTDQWAGTGAWLINEALGRGREGSGGRRRAEGGWTGRLTDAQSADQSMRTYAELR